MAFSVYIPDLPTTERSMPPRIPLTSYRHAGPSGPWPWADMVEDDGALFQPVPDMHMPGARASESQSQRAAWRKYPTHLFPNWEGSRLVRSGIANLIKKPEGTGPDCVVYYVHVEKSGEFSKAVGQYRVPHDRPDEFLGDLEVRACATRSIR